MSETITTTTAREGIQRLDTVGAEPVGWDGCEDMPEAYGQACAELTAETLTRAGMLVLGVLGDTDLVYMEGDEVCVGLVAVHAPCAGLPRGPRPLASKGR